MTRSKDIIVSIPGVVYQHICAEHSDIPFTTLNVTKRGRGTTAQVMMTQDAAMTLRDRLEASYELLYVSAGTDEQVRTAYAVGRYAERLTNDMKRSGANV